MITGKEILKNNPITNIDITNAIGHINGFNGVFAHDMLPVIEKSNVNFGVVNYHNTINLDLIGLLIIITLMNHIRSSLTATD